MSLIPEEELREKPSLNLAPMVDFLFIVVAIFAVIAVTRTALYDSEINLATVSAEKGQEAAPQNIHVVNLSINEQGQYKWISDAHEYIMENLESIQNELVKQQEMGVLPKDSKQVKVLLHIDKDAHWDPIAQAIFAVKEVGFHVYPVYEEQDNI